MTVYLPYLILLFLANLLFVACSSEEEEPVIEEEEEEEYVITDPFYADIDNDTTLEEYWEIFRQTPALKSRSGWPQYFVFYGTEPDFASGVTAEHAGRAYTICDESDIRFEIIQSFLEDFTIVQRSIPSTMKRVMHAINTAIPVNPTRFVMSTANLPIMWRSIPQETPPLKNLSTIKTISSPAVGKEFVTFVRQTKDNVHLNCTKWAKRYNEIFNSTELRQIFNAAKRPWWFGPILVKPWESEVAEGRQFKLIIDGAIACVWAIVSDPQIWEERDHDLYLYPPYCYCPAFRGRALKTLVQWAKVYAEKQEKKFVRLDTLGENTRLIAYYQEMGFDFLGIFSLKNTAGLPVHYHNTPACLFEIQL